MTRTFRLTAVLAVAVLALVAVVTLYGDELRVVLGYGTPCAAAEGTVPKRASKPHSHDPHEGY